MILQRGNMWDIWGKTDLFLVTTNPIVNAKGELVMGRGIAKQMADSFPGAAKKFADITAIGRALGWPWVYTCYYEPMFGRQTTGYFMVKSHWKEPAKLPIIMRSTADLMDMAGQYERIDLNFPGIGNGNLSRELVLPIISALPDNVYVWELPSNVEA